MWINKWNFNDENSNHFESLVEEVFKVSKETWDSVENILSNPKYEWLILVKDSDHIDWIGIDINLSVFNSVMTTDEIYDELLEDYLESANVWIILDYFQNDDDPDKIKLFDFINNYVSEIDDVRYKEFLKGKLNMFLEG